MEISSWIAKIYKKNTRMAQKNVDKEKQQQQQKKN